MDEQKRNQIIAEKLNEGYNLGDVQKYLAEEYNLNLTYLDLRLIASELDVDWEQQEDENTVTENSSGQILDENQQSEAGSEPGAQEAGSGGGTQVSVDKVTRPDAVMSGTVSFTSGAKAKWFIDHSHQLSLSPEEGSEKPTQDDIVEFQQELQRVLKG